MPLDRSTYNDALVLRALFNEAPDGWDSSADVTNLGAHLEHLSFAEKVGHLARNLVNAMLDGQTSEDQRFYLVATLPSGQVTVREVPGIACSLASIGDRAIENQGDDTTSIWQAARDGLARVMPDTEDGAA